MSVESEEKFKKRLNKLSKLSSEKKKERLKRIEERENRFVEDVKYRLKDRLEQDLYNSLNNED